MARSSDVFSVRLGPELITLLHVLAAQKGCTASELVQQWVQEHVKRELPQALNAIDQMHGALDHGLRH